MRSENSWGGSDSCSPTGERSASDTARWTPGRPERRVGRVRLIDRSRYSLTSIAVAPSSTEYSIHSTSVPNGAPRTSRVATNTYAVPGTRSILRAASRSLRLERFRATALPTFFPATNPTSGSMRSPGAWNTTTPPLRRLDPVRYMDPNLDPGRRETYKRTLRGEFVTALGTTAPDERPSRTCAHARTETVLALAAAVVWLIGTLHYEVIPGWGESRYIRTATERGYSRDVRIETTPSR